MPEGAWFLTIGTSTAAAYNPLWAAYIQHDWKPNKIVVLRLLPPSDSIELGRINRVFNEFTSWVGRFSKELGKSIEVVPIACEEDAYSEYGRLFRTAVINEAGQPRAIDITPGRKFASVRGMLVGLLEKVENIFYLHLFDKSYLDRPLQEIPCMKWHLTDFTPSVRSGSGDE